VPDGAFDGPENVIVLEPVYDVSVVVPFVVAVRTTLKAVPAVFVPEIVKFRVGGAGVVALTAPL
jgi:hypothetical protein